MTSIYTIGHSTRPLDDFVALLRREGIGHLADVRAHLQELGLNWPERRSIP